MNIAVCEDEPVWRRIVSEKIQEYIGKTGMQAELRTFSSGRGFLCCGRTLTSFSWILSWVEKTAWKGSMIQAKEQKCQHFSHFTRGRDGKRL